MTKANCGEATVSKEASKRSQLSMRQFSETVADIGRGLHGGEPNACSEYLVIKSDETELKLSSKASLVLEKNDVLVIRTAGGGGYGKKE
ncbi:MAG: hydantoinase B/oxoprolinase family protein [Nitrososphaerota archaeon]